jgi:hypothetical protein
MKYSDDMHLCCNRFDERCKHLALAWRTLVGLPETQGAGKGNKTLMHHAEGAFAAEVTQDHAPWYVTMHEPIRR